jgi:hypothetical protein
VIFKNASTKMVILTQNFAILCLKLKLSFVFKKTFAEKIM